MLADEGLDLGVLLQVDVGVDHLDVVARDVGLEEHAEVLVDGPLEAEAGTPDAEVVEGVEVAVAVEVPIGGDAEHLQTEPEVDLLVAVGVLELEAGVGDVGADQQQQHAGQHRSNGGSFHLSVLPFGVDGSGPPGGQMPR